MRSPVDNRELFEVTAATVLDRTSIIQDALPVEMRAEAIEARLKRTVERLRESRQDQISVVRSVLNNQVILQLRDAENSRPLQLATITETDAEYYGETTEILAKRWQAVLQEEVEEIAYLTSPRVVRQRFFKAGQILFGIVITHLFIYFLHYLSTLRQQCLKEKHCEQLAKEEEQKRSQAAEGGSSPAEDSQAQTSNTSPHQPDSTSNTVAKSTATDMETRRIQLLEELRRQFSTEGRLKFHTSLQWLLFWLTIVLWYVGIYFIISTIPALMSFQDWVLKTPLKLLITWFTVGLSIRILKSTISRFTNVWKNHPQLTPGESQRKILRTSTITQAAKGLTQCLCIIVGIFITLSLFNVSTGSLLAGGAVLGLALSFGTQNLIKDLVNGSLILIEDQYAIGDVIVLSNLGADGFVENLNLFVTQLRNAEGQLITIHNSSINEVKNLTRLWSRVNFTIEIAYDSDPHQALKILNDVAQDMYNSPEWSEKMPNPPEVLGIDELSHKGILIRIWLQTAPLQQWSVGREFRLRVWDAFQEHDIKIGKPQAISYLEPSTTLRKSFKETSPNNGFSHSDDSALQS